MARNVVDELVVRLTADATRLQAELGKAETKAKTSGKRIGASFAAAFKTAAQFGVVAAASVTAVGTALTVAANKAADYADRIDKTAIRTRLARGTLQELAFAADQAGVEFTAIEANIRAFTGRLAEAERGSTIVADTFNRLGVALRDQNGALRDTEELFLDTLTALTNVENETQRAALAVQAFGEQGSALLPFLSAGAGGLDDLRAKARELGLVLSNESIAALVAYKDQLSTVKQEFGALGREVTTNFLPILTQGLLPAISQQVVPALRDLVERAVGVADAFDETGAPTQDFKDRIEAIAAAVGGLVTDLVALGEVSVGLVQVVTAPFAALGNVLGQLSVGVPNFLDAYRRAFSGDFSGFAGRPIDTLVPDVDDILRVALEQANAGLAGVRAGAGRFGSFVPGAPAGSSFTPSARTSGVSGIGPFGSGAGAPTGSTSDPVTIIAPSLNRALEDAGLIGRRELNAGTGPAGTRTGIAPSLDRAAEDAGLIGRDVIQAELERADQAIAEWFARRLSITQESLRLNEDSGTIGRGAILKDRADAAAAAEADRNAAIEEFERLRRTSAENAARRARAGTDALRIGEDTLQAQGAGTFGFSPSSDASQRVDELTQALRNNEIPVAQQITAFRELQALAPAIAAEFFGLATELLSAAAAARAVAASTADLRTDEDRLQAIRAVPSGGPTLPDPVGIVFDVGAVEDATNAQVQASLDAAARERDSAIQFATIVAQGGVDFAKALISGDAGNIIEQGFRTFGDIGAALLPPFAPFIKLGTDFFGSLFGGLVSDGGRESEGARAAGANVSGAPAISINLTQNVSLAVASLVGAEARQAFDRANTDLLRLIETNVLPRITRLEAAA